MLNYLLFVDSQITHFINLLLPHNQFFDKFFSFFSLTGGSFFIWVAIIILVVVLEEIMHPGIQKRDIKFVLIFLITFLITFVLSDLLLKNIFQRHRPMYTYEVHKVINLCPKDFSFPSSHAATAFASATVLAFFDKKRKWFYYGVAILISLSRIYLQCHYFGDVIAGCICGLFISVLIIKSKIKLIR
ncbi:MAG: phosphatase PAP2 family protein [bacterium]|nr:phosphatase PAP2 family protein [bacterium]